MKKTVLIFGSIAGVIVSAVMATSMAIMGCNPEFESGGMLLGYSSMIVAFVFIFVGVKSYRDKYLGGTITFWNGFKTGLLIALIASTFYVVTWAIEYNLFMPDFMEKYTAATLKQAHESGATAAMIDEQTKQMAYYSEMYKNPVWFTLFTYMEILPVGILMSLIAAFVFKRRPAVAVQ